MPLGWQVIVIRSAKVIIVVTLDGLEVVTFTVVDLTGPEEPGPVFVDHMATHTLKLELIHFSALLVFVRP